MSKKSEMETVGVGDIPRPPAWAMALVWLEEEIDAAPRQASDVEATEETRTYYQTRVAVLTEVEQRFRPENK